MMTDVQLLKYQTVKAKLPQGWELNFRPVRGGTHYILRNPQKLIMCATNSLTKLKGYVDTHVVGTPAAG